MPDAATLAAWFSGNQPMPSDEHREALLALAIQPKALTAWLEEWQARSHSPQRHTRRNGSEQNRHPPRRHGRHPHGQEHTDQQPDHHPHDVIEDIPAGFPIAAQFPQRRDGDFPPRQ